MKLNKNCVRDILMYVEENSTYKESNGFKNYFTLKVITFNDLCQTEIINSKYEHDTIYYTIEKMKDYGLIKTEDDPLNSNCFEGLKNYHIESITSKGHEFLDNAKNEIVWNNVNKIIEESGLEDCSLNILFDCICNETHKFLVK